MVPSPVSQREREVMSRPELPEEKVKLMYYTSGETFEERRYHIVAVGTNKMWHICSHWCGEKLLSEERLESVKATEK